ncbi:HlyD family efflux transporter periplasmic adaptor subunit [Paraburkholderia acidisoli]|uniref:HlyD family efflux transporter periplasmic adaptor subunit n=1 Tax=Paraburkholderia acidisoli TaxID=2571748 RepID=A0A7Z2GKG6_9BURK|nr:HlyD family secretion protein [Paraburkholderia acidisoli]QGZ63079.1 HlyD family efflux transporter periplasmic adaptor subunit [Paraburkholderia acidisoli]
MNRQSLIRVAVTLVTLLVALVLMWAIWERYMYAPWTRDGRVRANVINLSTDVSGLVKDVRVKDNQWVRKGDVLYVIDPDRFVYAVQQADADVARAQAQMQQAQAAMDANRFEARMRADQAARREKLSQDVVSEEARSDYGLQSQQSRAALEAARAAYAAAQANLQAALVRKETAQLDRVRSEVRAPTDGYITNLNLYPGDFVGAGVARMAMIDSRSFWVYGYFEETKVQRVHVGDRATVRLLGGDVDLRGHVDSIASGIVDRDNPTGGNDLLANVDPVFTWVRLAQRVPVRIHLDNVPRGIHLAMGMTCTITLKPK